MLPIFVDYQIFLRIFENYKTIFNYYKIEFKEISVYVQKSNTILKTSYSYKMKYF